MGLVNSVNKPTKKEKNINIKPDKNINITGYQKNTNLTPTPHERQRPRPIEPSYDYYPHNDASKVMG